MADKCPPPIADSIPGCDPSCWQAYWDTYTELDDDWQQDLISCDQFIEGEAAARVAMNQCCAQQT